MIYVLGLGALIGFALGHFSFRHKERWCRRCGIGLVCPDCLSLHPDGRVRRDEETSCDRY
jgi:hypothetical protein